MGTTRFRCLLTLVLLVVDEKRVYATGISNGAFFSTQLACELSDKIVAIAPVAGSIPIEYAKTTKPGRKVPVVYFQGTKDGIISYKGGSSVLHALAYLAAEDYVK